MPKRKTLISEAESVPKAKSQRGSCWEAAFRQSQPEQFAQVVALLKRWDASDRVIRDRFPSFSSLWRWLSGKDPDRPREPVIDCSRGVFLRLLESIRNGDYGRS